MYRTDLYGLIDECVGHILEQIASLKTSAFSELLFALFALPVHDNAVVTGHPTVQAALTAEFFDVTATLAELNAKSGNLAANLLNLAKQPDSGLHHLRRAFKVMGLRDNAFQQQLFTKLSV